MKKYCLLPVILLVACGGGSEEPVTSTQSPDPVNYVDRPSVDAAVPEEIRTLPDPICALDNLGTTGLLVPVPDTGMPGALQAGANVDQILATQLPDTVYLRDGRHSFSDQYYFVLHDGRIYIKANRETTGVDEPWRAVLLPSCLDGQVTAISADGTVLLALDSQRWIYTLDSNANGPESMGWTRRWGPYFWTDGGEALPPDVGHWATSQLNSDEIYFDSAGREQVPAGILTLYALRGDGLRITYMDPWLPSDESREVCGPERGTVAMAGLSGSGSVVMVISREGRVYTRLYEFDISGANSMFLDYSWQEQNDVAEPLIQLPPPGWIEHAPIPGVVTDRVSLHKQRPYTSDRILRVEGQNDLGQNGYWEKPLQADNWQFVMTGLPLIGRPLPLEGASHYKAEDSVYVGEIDGWPARIDNFNAYCAPSRFMLHIGEGPATELILHSTDGMRQERRARGLDGQRRMYRSAVEVPRALWEDRESQPRDVRNFLDSHFPHSRFLVGPLWATANQLRIGPGCWSMQAEVPVQENLPGLTTLPSGLDAGILVGEIRAAEEEGRAPAFCP